VEAVTQKFNNELVFDPEAEVGNLSFSNYELPLLLSVGVYRACRSGFGVSDLYPHPFQFQPNVKADLYSLKFFQQISIHSTVQSTENYDTCDADEKDNSM